MVSRKTAVIGALLGVAAIGVGVPSAALAASGDSSQQTVEANIEGGSLLFSQAPSVPGFGAISITGQPQTINPSGAATQWGVKDLTGTSAGWNVTAAANGPFTDQKAKESLAENSLVFNSTNAQWAGGVGKAPTFSCSSGCPFDQTKGVTLSSAGQGGGMGAWATSGITNTDYALALPADVQAGSYSTTVTYTLAAGPK